MAGLPSSVAGFTVLPLSYSGSSTHYLYARPHSGSKKAKGNVLPEGRTLFLANIPPDATEREIVVLFKYCGTVERVIFDLDSREPQQEESDSDDDVEEVVDVTTEDAEVQPRKRRKVSKGDEPQAPKVVPLPSKSLRTLWRTGQSAHVVFLDSSSLDRALSHPPKPRPWPTSSEEPSGIAHYTALYDSLRPPLDAIREHADSAMALYEYDLAKTKQKSKYRKGEAIVDEDGFTLVTRGGAYGQTLGGGVGVASKKFQEGGQSKKNRNKKKNDKEKEGFYAFQRAEKQRNGVFRIQEDDLLADLLHAELMELKKNWEADKVKIEKLKASRRFKPY